MEVLDGKKYVVGELVRRACKRHMDDLARDDWAWHYSAALGKRACGWIRENLVFVAGEAHGKEFRLLPWQRFLVYSLYGWINVSNHRRFQTLYLETGRGSGKTPLCAALALYHCFEYNKAPHGCEGVIFAANFDQSKYTFGPVMEFAGQLNELHRREKGMEMFIDVEGGDKQPKRLLRKHKNVSLRRVANPLGKSGIAGGNVHFLACDELHEHTTAERYNALRSSMKDPRYSLFVVTTNAGEGREGVCWDEHELAIASVNPDENRELDRFLGFICTVDDADDPFEDESCWEKANPSLYKNLPPRETIRTAVRQSQGSPSKHADVARWWFTRWTDGAEEWFTKEKFLSVTTNDKFGARDRDGELKKFPSDAELKRMPCFGGADLSEKIDMTCIALVWYKSKDEMFAKVFPYLPDANPSLAVREKRDNTNYTAWSKMNPPHLRIHRGPTIDYRDIADFLEEVFTDWGVRIVAYDSRHIDKLVAACENARLPIYKRRDTPLYGGMELVEVKQGAFQGQVGEENDPKKRLKMATKNKVRFLLLQDAMDLFEYAVYNGRILIQENYALTRAVAGIRVNRAYGGNGPPLPNKKDSKFKIDPVIALVQAYRAALAFGEDNANAGGDDPFAGWGGDEDDDTDADTSGEEMTAWSGWD